MGYTLLTGLAVVLGLRGLVWLGEKVPMIEETGAEIVDGPLRRVPIRFAQTDFWFYPPRVEAELGHLRVPARRSHPNEASLELRFVRFPAVGEAARSAPIVYLAGGPGGSGVDTASGDRYPFFMKLREAGDVIAFDQRGTRHTEPHPVCPGAWSYPPDRVFDTGAMVLAHEPVLRDCWSHWSKRLHPGTFTTVESAEDLESLRLALGVERLSLVGISYGTHLALAYIRSHPDRVERVVLAGVEGPDHTYKRPSVVDGVLREIDQTLESEAGWSGLITDLESALERLSREQPRVIIEDPDTGDDVEVALGPLDLERLDLIAREEPGSLIGEAINLDLTTICPFWPVDDLGASYRSPIESTVQVLAISGTLDPRTPPSNADEVLSGFVNGLHLKIIGGGHGDDLLIATPEIAAAMTRFFNSGDPGRERIVLPSF